MSNIIKAPSTGCVAALRSMFNQHVDTRYDWCYITVTDIEGEFSHINTHVDDMTGGNHPNFGKGQVAAMQEALGAVNLADDCKLWIENALFSLSESMEGKRTHLTGVHNYFNPEAFLCSSPSPGEEEIPNDQKPFERLAGCCTLDLILGALVGFLLYKAVKDGFMSGTVNRRHFTVLTVFAVLLTFIFVDVNITFLFIGAVIGAGVSAIAVQRIDNSDRTSPGRINQGSVNNDLAGDEPYDSLLIA